MRIGSIDERWIQLDYRILGWAEFDAVDRTKARVGRNVLPSIRRLVFLE